MIGTGYQSDLAGPRFVDAPRARFAYRRLDDRDCVIP
jgi:hypothetical protein